MMLQVILLRVASSTIELPSCESVESHTSSFFSLPFFFLFLFFSLSFFFSSFFSLPFFFSTLFFLYPFFLFPFFFSSFFFLYPFFFSSHFFLFPFFSLPFFFSTQVPFVPLFRACIVGKGQRSSTTFSPWWCSVGLCNNANRVAGENCPHV